MCNTEQQTIEQNICELLQQIKGCCTSKEEIDNIKLQIDSIQLWMNSFQEGIHKTDTILLSSAVGDIEENTPLQEVLEYLYQLITDFESTGSVNLTVSNRNNNTLNITPLIGVGATIPFATTSLAGLLTSADKTKLDGIATGANLYTHPNHSGDVVSVSDGATTIQTGVVSNTKLANMLANTIKGSVAGGVPADLTPTQIKSILAYTATEVVNTPAGNISSTNVQTAINELDGEKQLNLQFQEEGVNLGTSGTVNTVNFTGANITASRAGNIVTVDVTGGSGGGVTNLTVANKTSTTLDVASDTGTDATIPQATITEAGLLTASDKVKLNSTTGTNTGDQTSIVGITGTKTQFDTALTDGNFLYVGDISQYTDELAQDAIGLMVDSTLVYTDATPLLTRAALTGDVVASQGSNATTITNNVVTNAKLAQAPALTLKGNNTGGTANVIDLTASQVKTMLSITGSDVNNTPSGNIASTTIQGAINELDAEKQTAVQYQNEGTNLSTAGTVDVINFTGLAINAVRTGNTLTVDVSATSGVTNLGYTASSTNGIVTSDTGSDATIPLVTGTEAGLLSPTDYTKIGNITITQPVNLDTLESDTVTNNAKVTNATHTGDASGATVLTLATVNTNIGTFGTGTQVPQFTVNAKGLVTGVTNVTITPAANSITGGAALTKVDDTNVTLTLGGSPTTSLLAATSLTLGWTGTLSTTRGGTGLSTLGTANQQLRVNAGGTALEYFTPVTSGGITSLNGLTGAVQTFTNDTNISIVSGGTAHVITWNGTLADNRITSSANWNTAFNNRITSLTTTGNSGVATLISNVLNIPNYTLVGLGGQPLDADLTAIASLAGTSGILRKTATDTWTLDTNAYLTANQTITLSGEATGSGTTSIPVTLSNSAVIGKVLTGFTSSTGTILPTDSILQAIQKLNGNLAAATAGGISSVSGTTNRITSTGGTNPVIDISASYVGQTSLTTLGTITTGVWNGTAITDTYISSASTWNSKQAGVQYKDEGIALGTAATVTEINFTGNGISASRTGNIVTVNVGATAGVTNLTYTSSATDGIVVSDTGSDATIPAASGTIAGLMIPAQFTKLSNITVTQAVDLDALEQDVADLTTLSGVASNATTLGTFTGTTIPDSSTVKAAIQSLETALESATISDPTKNIRVVSVNTTLSATTDGTVVFDTASTVATLPTPTNKLMLVVKNVSGGNMTVTGHLDEVAAQTFTIASLESYRFHSNGSTFYIIS